VFAGSGSLTNRIALAVGIHSLGVEAYFRQLFKSMGIGLSDNVAYYLNTREKKRLAAIRTKAAKLKKNKRKFDKLKKATTQAKKEFHKRQGTYKKGMNMDDPYGENASEDKPATCHPLVVVPSSSIVISFTGCSTNKNKM
jgi:hypothetical protein